MFFSSKRPTNLGVHNGKLAKCKGSPNCVSSQTNSKKHHVEPIQLEGDPRAAMQRLAALLRGMDNITVVEEKDDYIYAECRSKLFGFVDDLEFYWDGAKLAADVRSASRLGYSDLGVNRKRVEEIRDKFEG